MAISKMLKSKDSIEDYKSKQWKMINSLVMQVVMENHMLIDSKKLL